MADRDPLVRRTIGLCFLAAVFEGIDLQSMGIASTQLIPEFGLSKTQYGLATSMSMISMPIGAALGGRAIDAFGRKRVLAASLVILGLFSLLTTHTDSYSYLLVMRFLVGLGLGATFPTLISIASECAKDKQSRPISLMYAGIPMGTIMGTLLVLFNGAQFEWRWIFYVGGYGPILLAPIILAYLPASADAMLSNVRRETPQQLVPVRQVLFSEKRAMTSLLLWIAFFFTLLIIYLLTNWLNQLMAQRGFAAHEGTIVLLGFGVGSVLGGLAFGAIVDAGHRRFIATLAYVGIAVCLAGLALLEQFVLVVIASTGAGFFAVGAQLINYALAPRFYHTAIRGTGVGVAVAVGRLGSVAGPLLAGILLGSGFSASTVLLTFVPGLVIAAMAASILMARAFK